MQGICGGPLSKMDKDFFRCHATDGRFGSVGGKTIRQEVVSAKSFLVFVVPSAKNRRSRSKTGLRTRPDVHRALTPVLRPCWRGNKKAGMCGNRTHPRRNRLTTDLKSAGATRLPCIPVKEDTKKAAGSQETYRIIKHVISSP